MSVELIKDLKRTPRRGGMSVEQIKAPRSTPRRGEMSVEQIKGLHLHTEGVTCLLILACPNVIHPFRIRLSDFCYNQIKK